MQLYIFLFIFSYWLKGEGNFLPASRSEAPPPRALGALGIEPRTSVLSGQRSATELRAQNLMRGVIKLIAPRFIKIIFI